MQEEAGAKMEKANEVMGTFRRANTDGWEMDKDKEDVFEGAFEVEDDDALTCGRRSVAIETSVQCYPAPTATAL
jgi:hypothetical protein